MRIFEYPPEELWPEILRRPITNATGLYGIVSEILANVRMNGDRALKEYAEKFDGATLDSLSVSTGEIDRACEKTDPELTEAIRTAVENVRKFHEAQRYRGIEVETMPGVRCSQRSVPIRKVGLYVPGGSAPLFSTVIMLAVPASIAGCGEIVLCTPPDREGKIADAILYTARLCGVTRIFKAGGAQAIAAMAYGTETIPKTDKIFGPGNQFVTVAKQQVSLYEVAIDMPAGPSEVMVMADDTADPAFVASDLLSQAEHGKDSQSVLVTTSGKFAGEVSGEVEQQMSRLSRSELAKEAIGHSRIIVVSDREEAIRIANFYAAEHLIVSMDNPWDVANRITAAGSVFIGNYTPESAGDYASGTNHTLPTDGWAASYSGVNLDSFMRKITYQEITPEGLRGIAPVIDAMAMAEGLDAHANAVKIRMEKIGK